MNFQKCRSTAISFIVLLFTVSSGFSSNETADQAERIRRIETKTLDLQLDANETPIQLGLKKLMELYKVPGLSVAVIEDYRVVWAKAYGVTDRGSKKRPHPRQQPLLGREP